MTDEDHKPEQPPPVSGGATENLPFPESGYSPALQRTLKAKFDRGDIGGVDKAEFLKQLGQTAKPEQPAEE